MPEAVRQFRRVNGHLHLPALRTALERGELALGHLARRSENWGLLHNLPQATVATDLEVLTLIDNQTCWGWASVRRRAPDGRYAADDRFPPVDPRQATRGRRSPTRTHQQ